MRSPFAAVANVGSPRTPLCDVLERSFTSRTGEGAIRSQAKYLLFEFQISFRISLVLTSSGAKCMYTEVSSSHPCDIPPGISDCRTALMVSLPNENQDTIAHFAFVRMVTRRAEV